MFINIKQLKTLLDTRFDIDASTKDLFGITLPDYSHRILENWLSLESHRLKAADLRTILSNPISDQLDLLSAIFDGKTKELPILPDKDKAGLTVLQNTIMQQMLNGGKRLKYEIAETLNKQPIADTPRMGDWIGFYALPTASSFHLIRSPMYSVFTQAKTKPNLVYYHPLPELYNPRLAFWMYIRKPLHYKAMDSQGFLTSESEHRYVQEKRMFAGSPHHQELPQPFLTGLPEISSGHNLRYWNADLSYVDIVREVHFTSHLFKVLFAGVLSQDVLSKQSPHFAAECLINLKSLDQTEIYRASVILSHLQDKIPLQDKVGIDTGIHALLGLSPRFYLLLDAETVCYVEALLRSGYAPRMGVFEHLQANYNISKELARSNQTQEQAFMNEVAATNAISALLSKV